jgi:hypothetical protein
MLERYAVKVARTVLRGGSGSNTTLPYPTTPSSRGERPDAGDDKRQCACSGRCSLEARSPDLRHASQSGSFLRLGLFPVGRLRQSALFVGTKGKVI